MQPVFDNTRHLVVLKEVRELLAENRQQELKALLTASSAGEIKKILQRLGDSEVRLLLSMAPVTGVCRAFAQLVPDRQQQLLGLLNEKTVEEMLQRLAVDEITMLIGSQPEEELPPLLELLDRDTRDRVLFQLSYPPESTGRIMTPDYFTLPPEITGEEALKELKKKGADSETIKNIYITGEDGYLLDRISLRSIILSDPETRVEELMDRKMVTLSPEDDREEAVKTMDTYDEYVLPVVDEERRIIGIVTMDDAMKFAGWEATEDIQRLGGSEPLEGSYFSTSLFRLAKKRVGWLLVLFLAASFSSQVIGFFEEQLAAAVILSFFIPLLIGTGGNAGSQTVTAVIRGLALGEIKFKQLPVVILKELTVSLLLGGILGLAGFSFVYFYWRASLAVALVLAFSLPAVCMLANGIAAAVPVLVDRLGLDPAVVSAPLITTCVDVGGLVVYFLIAAAVLGL